MPARRNRQRPLGQAVWQAWLTKGRLQEERSTRHRLEAVRVASIVGLLAAAGPWSYVAPYEIALRFGVAAASIFVMFHALRSRHYAFAAVFGALALRAARCLARRGLRALLQKLKNCSESCTEARIAAKRHLAFSN
jgi:hypothetical protein